MKICNTQANAKVRDGALAELPPPICSEFPNRRFIDNDGKPIIRIGDKCRVDDWLQKKRPFTFWVISLLFRRLGKLGYFRRENLSHELYS